MQLPGFNFLDLADEAGYRRWREQKLDSYPGSVADILVAVADPGRLSAAEHAALLASCRKTNMGFYRQTNDEPAGKDAIRALGSTFGLNRLDRNLRSDEDSITSLRVVAAMSGSHYIPYTSKPLNWHTDGYYNTLDEQVRGIVMHCVRPAQEGGENAFLDPEIAYLMMRDENPALVAAMMHPEAMTIPPNTEAGVEIRGSQPGPVFSLEKASATLHMRYTARTRSIAWRDDADTQAAVSFLQELLASDLPYIYRYRLGAGEGIICNNVLHSRSAFIDSDQPGRQRLLYRARYHDRIAGTEGQAMESANAVAE